MFRGGSRADEGGMEFGPAEAIAINQSAVQTRVDYAVARKMLETQEASGAAAVEMIKAAGKAQAETLRGPGTSGVSGLGECIDCDA